MGAAVIGITIVWQMYKRRGKEGKSEDTPDGPYGGGRPGAKGALGRGAGRDGTSYADRYSPSARGEPCTHDRSHQMLSRAAGAEAHFAAHMTYGRSGAGGVVRVGVGWADRGR